MEAIPAPSITDLNPHSIERMLQDVIRYDFAQSTVFVTDRSGFERICQQLESIPVHEDATRASIGRVLSIRDNLDGPEKADCGMFMWAKTEQSLS